MSFMQGMVYNNIFGSSSETFNNSVPSKIITDDYVGTLNDYMIVCNFSTEKNITLPSEGSIFIIKSIGDGVVNILTPVDGISNFKLYKGGSIMVTNSGGSFYTVASKVTNAKLAQMPTMTIKGNDAVGNADPQDLTVPEVITMITDPTHRFVTDAQITQWSRATAKAWVRFSGIGTVLIRS